MNNKNYYETLEVDKTATQDEIKKSYRELCKRYHPDKHNGDKEAEEKFKKITEAYNVLSDVKKRENYDNPESNSFYSNFNMSERFLYGDNVVIKIELTLNQIYNGTVKTQKYKRKTKCDTCNGLGGSDVKMCGVCNGNGVEIRTIQTPIGYIRQSVTCRGCNGTGETYITECNTCKGSGIKLQEETIELNIPVGVEEGMSFLMEGKGDYIKGGQHGDLHIIITEVWLLL
jgi:molecular chaperone DnaJ